MQTQKEATGNDPLGRLFILATKEIPDTAEMLDTLCRLGGLAEAIQVHVLSESQGQVVA